MRSPRTGQAEDFVAHIRALAVAVDRREAVVRGFIQPSLMALRDATSATGGRHGPGLRDLVSDQFHRIEMTVAGVASMHDAMMRAAALCATCRWRICRWRPDTARVSWARFLSFPVLRSNA